MAESKIAGRTGGVLSFTIDAVPHEAEASSLTVQRFRFQRESVPGLTGPGGHKQTAIQPYMELTLLYKRGTLLANLRAIQGSTVQVNAYAGQKYTAEDSYQVGELELDVAEGTVTLRVETEQEIREW